MREVLRGLGETPGIRGCLVVSGDGMVVASHLSERLPEDQVAAMASAVISKVERALADRGLGGIERLTLTAGYGRMVFRRTGATYLVVVTDRDFEPGPTDLEVESAALRIKSLEELKVV